MAHSIKNPEKIHLVEEDGRYLCIKACSTTPSKSTTDPLKITCKRCLSLIEKK